MNTTEHHMAMQMNKLQLHANEQAIAACKNIDKFHKLIKQKKQEEKECKLMSLYKIKKQTTLIVFLRDTFMYFKLFLESRKIITRITRVILCE